MGAYYHLYSNHSIDSLILGNDEDKAFFLNRLALCLLGNGDVKCYAYCLMDTHFHLLMSGESPALMEMFAKLRHDYAQHLGNAGRNMKKGLEDFYAQLRPVSDIVDFRSVVAYILRNPYVAGMDSPVSYRWSSAFLYFNPHKDSCKALTTSDLGMTNVRRLLRTRTPISRDLMFFGDIIHPRQWCDYAKVESIFGKSMDLFNALGRWTIENDVESAYGNVEFNSYPDSFLLEKALQFCGEIGARDIGNLDATSSRRLVRRLHRTFGASLKQIVRITGVDEETIRRFW